MVHVIFELFRFLGYMNLFFAPKPYGSCLLGLNLKDGFSNFCLPSNTFLSTCLSRIKVEQFEDFASECCEALAGVSKFLSMVFGVKSIFIYSTFRS